MLRVVEVMHGKLLTVFITVCVIFTINGCDAKKKKENKQSDAKTAMLQTKDVDKYDLKDTTTFKTENADVLLKNSKELPHSDNVTFTPLALNDQNEVFGESVKHNEKVALVMLNINTGIYKELFLAEKGTTIGVSSANNDYVFFTVDYPQKGKTVYYCMNINDSTTKVISKSPYYSIVAVPQMALVNHTAYISLPTSNDKTDKLNYPLVCYNMKNDKQEVIEEGTTGYPVILNNELYYIRIDNKKKTTYIIQYDLQTKKKKILAQGNEKDGYFYNLVTDGESLVVQLNYMNNINDFYKLEKNPAKLIPYFQADASSFEGFNGYFTWVGSRENDEQIRKPYTLFDSKKNIVYKYNGSLIYVSNKGVLWVKYTKKENEIPKGEIFTKDNSVLMWHSFS